MRSTRSDVTLSPAVREGFAAAVRESLGLVFPPSRAPALDRGIASAAALLGEPDPAVLLGRLLDGDPAVREALIVELTVGETYLFRDDNHFAFVRDVAIPEAARLGDDPVRVVDPGGELDEAVDLPEQQQPHDREHREGQEDRAAEDALDVGFGDGGSGHRGDFLRGGPGAAARGATSRGTGIST